jgi:hypothetical protein
MPEIGPLCESRPGGHSLAARMAEGPLPLAAVLGYAGDVAKELGELHHSGAAHGEVAPVAIRLNERGALLLPSHGRARAANPREDVSAFGAVLSEMLAGNGGAGGAIREAASRLAAGCLASGMSLPICAGSRSSCGCCGCSPGSARSRLCRPLHSPRRRPNPSLRQARRWNKSFPLGIPMPRSSPPTSAHGAAARFSARAPALSSNAFYSCWGSAPAAATRAITVTSVCSECA